MNTRLTAAPAPERRLAVLVPHLVWEGVLLLLVVAVVATAAARVPLFEGGLWWQIATFGLLATGLAMSLRTATPNLAVGALAGLAAGVYAWTGAETNAEPGPQTVGIALLAVLVVAGFGLIMGLITGLTSAPAWAVSLGGMVLAYAVVLALLGVQPARVQPVWDAPGGWLAVFLLVSLAGGTCLALLPAVARWLGSDHVGERPPRFRVNRLVAAVVGMTGSSLLAGVAGLAIASRSQAAVPDVGILWLSIAVAAAMIGGVSAAGGRGGILGTVLGTVLIAVVYMWLTMENLGNVGDARLDLVALYVLLGVLTLVGLGVGRGLSAVTTAFSRRAPAPPPAAPPPPAPSPSLPPPPPATEET